MNYDRLAGLVLLLMPMTNLEPEMDEDMSMRVGHKLQTEPLPPTRGRLKWYFSTILRCTYHARPVP